MILFFFDSVGALRLDYDLFQSIIKNKGKTSLFFIFQSTKSGNFRGSQEYEHEIDISFYADSGKISLRKNRFGGTGEYTVY